MCLITYIYIYIYTDKTSLKADREVGGMPNNNYWYLRGF